MDESKAVKSWHRFVQTKDFTPDIQRIMDFLKRVYEAGYLAGELSATTKETPEPPPEAA